jgi:hypothetical protein
MPGAAYYRRQAKLYRELARHLSDRRDAETALAASDLARRRAERQLLKAKGPLRRENAGASDRK